MRFLHLVANANATSEAIIAAQIKKHPDQVVVIDLRKEDCDYDQVLEEIFQADSIHVC